MKKTISEILDEFTRANTRQEKIDVLRRNYSSSLRHVLEGAFHPNIRFVFEEVPQYKKGNIPDGMGHTTIDYELGRLYLFEKDNPRVSRNLTLDRKKQLFIQVLESLDDRESSMLANMIMKKSLVPGLTYNLVCEAFPGLLPEQPDGTQEEEKITLIDLGPSNKNQFLKILNI